MLLVDGCKLKKRGEPFRSLQVIFFSSLTSLTPIFKGARSNVCEAGVEINEREQNDKKN